MRERYSEPLRDLKKMNDTGILNIYKPAGMTSHDVVAAVRKKLGIKRVGHTGTLDPMATGVLPVCVGRAARITEYLDLDFKTYSCSMTLGKVTDTQDIWGKVIEERTADGITESDVIKAFEPFRGVIDQKPPMYSAVRVDGRRLYEYAREGKTVDVKTRKIYIDSLHIKKIDLSCHAVDFSVRCSKGTYIRTICQDVGETLGCGAVMSHLERTESGVFNAETAVKTDDLMEMSREEILKLLLPADYPLVHFGRLTVDSKGRKMFLNGRHLPPSICRVEKEPELKSKKPPLPVREEYSGAYNVYQRAESEDIFLGVAFFDERYGKYKADKVLCEVTSFEDI